MSNWVYTNDWDDTVNWDREFALSCERLRKALDKRSLTLLLPVSALGLDGDTDAEIIVEYAQDRNDPVDPNKFVINIWVMESGINMMMGVTTLFTPTVENEGPLEQAARIFSVVSNNKTVQAELVKAIKTLRKSGPEHRYELPQ